MEDTIQVYLSDDKSEMINIAESEFTTYVNDLMESKLQDMTDNVKCDNRGIKIKMDRIDLNTYTLTPMLI